jgi:thioredoxin 1
MKLIKFYADWCAPCRALTPTIEKIVQNNSTIQYETINVDEDDETCKQYDVRGIPAVVILDGNGNVVDKIFGNKPEEVYLEALKNDVDKS